MGKRSNILFAGLVLLSMVIAASGCARWGHRYYDAEWVTKKIDERIYKLDLQLTDEQTARLNIVKDKIVEHITSRKDSKANMLSLFKEEVKKEDPDFNGLVKSYKESNHKRKENVDEIVDRLNEFYLSLDNAQKRKIVNAIKEDLDKCKRWAK